MGVIQGNFGGKISQGEVTPGGKKGNAEIVHLPFSQDSRRAMLESRNAAAAVTGEIERVNALLGSVTNKIGIAESMTSQNERPAVNQ
jgi:hypothetical protein